MNQPPFKKVDRVRVVIGPGRSASHEWMRETWNGKVGTVVDFYWEMAGVGPSNKKGWRTRRYIGARVRFERASPRIPFHLLELADEAEAEGAVLRADTNTPEFRQ
jgi:hypothetical protein